ncbi:MAG TPA: hypothetical protein VMI75_15420 [Polyangiaceae bacterium]|nr:hypothetical protein [Polyangiaceae bacterium]
MEKITFASTTLASPRGKPWIDSPARPEPPFTEWPFLIVGLLLITLKIIVLTSKSPAEPQEEERAPGDAERGP